MSHINMKNFSNLLIGLSAAFAFTACSSEEAPNVAPTDITVTVATDATISRAIATVPGYDLTCVMQLVDDNGATIGTQATASAATGSASFTIKGTDIEAGASKALFWAEYVPQGSTPKVYNSSDLTNISYNVTTFDMTDANLMAAADAFAGTITTLSNGASATLSRPMIQFNFTPTNPEAAAGATTLKVAYKATSGFNVLTSNCVADAAQELTYNNASFDPAAKWITSYIFAPANMSTFAEPITMTVGGGVNAVLTIPADKVPLDANNIVNTSAEITIGGDTNLDVDVNVDINGSFDNEPKPAVFEVGAYVDAAGKPVSDKANAAGIIYYVGAFGEDVPANYAAAYSSKTIKGYAVALENISATRLSCGDKAYGDIFVTNEKTSTNGYQTTPYMLEKLAGSPIIEAYQTWTAAHALNTENVSGWYIPSKNQIYDFLSMLYPHGKTLADAEPATGTDAFKALFPLSQMNDSEKTVMYLSSTVNTASPAEYSQARVNMADGAVSFVYPASLGIVKDPNRVALCRAMFTIFE